MQHSSAQDLTRGIINKRRNAVFALLAKTRQERKNCSAYIAQLAKIEHRMASLCKPPIYKVMLAVLIDQIILLAIFAFLLLPAFVAANDKTLHQHFSQLGPFPLASLTTAHLFFAAFACLALQLFLYTAKFEGSPWQATPGKALFKMKSCDCEGLPLTFEASAISLFGQHMLVLLATVTIVIPVSCTLKDSCPSDTLSLLLPLVPIFAYFIMGFVKVEGRSIFQMVSRHTVVSDVQIKTRSMPGQALKVLFFGSKEDEHGQLDLLLAAMTMLSLVWLAMLLWARWQ